MSNDLRFNGPCSRCGNLLGEMSFDEFRFLFDVDGPEALCFDCDLAQGRLYPEFLDDLQQDDRVGIDGEIYTYDLGLLKRGSGWKPRTHERERARVSSSYTNLNRTQENLSVLDELLDYEICPECRGQGIYVPIYGGDSCDTCEDAGAIAILPRWIAKIVCGDVVHV